MIAAALIFFLYFMQQVGNLLRKKFLGAEQEIPEEKITFNEDSSYIC